MRFMVLAFLLSGCLNRALPESTAAETANGRSDMGDGLVVATYNVHGASASALAQAISKDHKLSAADLLFFQEIERESAADVSTADELGQLVGMNYAYAPGYGLPEGGSHGVAILSSYPLRDVEVIELPRYSVVFNSARRVALAANLEVKGRRVRVYSVHLDNRLNPKDRVRQMQPVLDDAENHDVPTVIAGDFNTSPFCWAGAVFPVPCGIQDNRLEAAVRKSGFRTPVTRSGPTSKWLGMRLDAIYTKGLATDVFGVARSVRVSDHLPLWARLRVEP